MHHFKNLSLSFSLRVNDKCRTSPEEFSIVCWPKPGHSLHKPQTALASCGAYSLALVSNLVWALNPILQIEHRSRMERETTKLKSQSRDRICMALKGSASKDLLKRYKSELPEPTATVVESSHHLTAAAARHTHLFWRDTQEMPTLEKQVQLSLQRTTEPVLDAMLPGQTVLPLFSKLQTWQICNYVLAHTCFAKVLNSKNSYFALKSFGITSRATSK